MTRRLHTFLTSPPSLSVLVGMLVAGVVLALQQSGYLEHWALRAYLESFNKDAREPIAEESPCRILPGESTVRLLHPDSYDIRRIGNVVLKGKEQEVTVF